VFPDLGRYAVDQHVLAALRRVHEFETYARVGRWESREVMRNRAAVAIVPIFDPGQRLPVARSCTRAPPPSLVGVNQR
jgi:hypothetical protein